MTHSSTSAPSPPAALYRPRCRARDARIDALRGSGAQQMQYATLRVRNTAATTCWLVGAPTAQLWMGGHPLGSPARPTGAAGSALRLSTGQSAEAALSGPTTCNAGVSDHVRVSLPDTQDFTDSAVPMRGCPLFVGAFVRS